MTNYHQYVRFLQQESRCMIALLDFLRASENKSFQFGINI